MTWPDWVDDGTWELGPDHDVDQDNESAPPEDGFDFQPVNLLTLDQFIDRQAERLLDMGTRLGALLASGLKDLAELARLTRATTPQDLEARIEALEHDYCQPFEPEPELTASGDWA